jgi:hypothetical protein
MALAGHPCITADLILAGHSDLIDATQLSIDRFREGKLLEEIAVP